MVLNANGGLWKIFELPYTYSSFTFEELMNDIWMLFSRYLVDINPPGKKLDVIRHPNQYEETVSLGPRTGDILYNALRSMIEGKNYTNFIPVQNDPNTNKEVLERAGKKE